MQHSLPTCMPTGSFAPPGCSARPQGRHTAGRPARFRFTVIRSPAGHREKSPARSWDAACVRTPSAQQCLALAPNGHHDGLPAVSVPLHLPMSHLLTLVHGQRVRGLLAKLVRGGGRRRAQQRVVALQRRAHLALDEGAHLHRERGRRRRESATWPAAGNDRLRGQRRVRSAWRSAGSRRRRASA